MNNFYTEKLSTKQIEQLKKIKHIALDMDGTIYLGETIFPYTINALNSLSQQGLGYSFLTNNPTKSVYDYLKKLEKMGISATEEQMYTTSIACIDYLKRAFPKAKRLFFLGTESMISQFEKAGYTACNNSPDDIPDVLVVAFDPSLTYERLCRATWWASQGIPYIATNPDKVCPSNERTVLVDCGSLQKCIEYASGRKADVVLGKPDPKMLEGLLAKHSLKADEIAMVGDRLYTDIAMACNAGAFGVLVLSGETTTELLKEDSVKITVNDTADKANFNFPKPDLIVSNIEELACHLKAIQR